MSAYLVVLDADGEAELERLLNEEEWSLGRAGRAAIDEALIELRRLRVERAALVADVKTAMAYRKIAKAGPRSGRGGPLGGFPVDALNELARRLGVQP